MTEQEKDYIKMIESNLWDKVREAEDTFGKNSVQCQLAEASWASVYKILDFLNKQ